MKKFHLKLCLLSLFALPILAGASPFAGKWEGMGTFEAYGVGRYEADVSVEIRESEGSIGVHDCWRFRSEERPWHFCYDHSFRVENGMLFSGETEVGTIRENKIEIIYKRPEGQIHAVLDIQADGSMNGFHKAEDQYKRYTNKFATALQRKD